MLLLYFGIGLCVTGIKEGEIVKHNIIVDVSFAKQY